MYRIRGGCAGQTMTGQGKNPDWSWFRFTAGGGPAGLLLTRPRGAIWAPTSRARLAISWFALSVRKLAGRLPSWPIVGCSDAGLAGQLADSWLGGPMGCPNAWLAGLAGWRLPWLVGCLAGWLAAWLLGLLVGSFMSLDWLLREIRASLQACGLTCLVGSSCDFCLGGLSAR